LDFKGVPTIGQAFADEIFRVFANEHPNVALRTANANSEVKRLIDRVLGGRPLPLLLLRSLIRAFWL
jgi:hypothetical protein